MEKKRFQNFLFGIVAVGGAILIACLMGEALVYGAHRKEMALFPRYVTQRQYGDYAIRSNLPGAQYWHKSFDGRWHFRINRQGFRSDTDYAREKPPQTLRVLVLGDSFTAGYEVGQDETYSAVLEKELQAKGIAAQVLNAGVAGFSNAEELVFLGQEGIAYRPDVIVLGYYSNDLTDNIRAGLFGLDGDGQLTVQSKSYVPVGKIHDFLHSIPVYRWLSENSHLHNYLNAAATQQVVAWLNKKREADIAQSLAAVSSPAPMPDYQARLACRIVEKIHAVATQNGAVFILMEIPEYTHGTISLSWPRQACAPEKVSDIYVDGFSLLKKEAPGKVWYRPHGHNHWTPVSHAAAGRHLAALLAKRPGISPPSVAQKSGK